MRLTRSWEIHPMSWHILSRRPESTRGHSMLPSSRRCLPSHSSRHLISILTEFRSSPRTDITLEKCAPVVPMVRSFSGIWPKRSLYFRSMRITNSLEESLSPIIAHFLPTLFLFQQVMTKKCIYGPLISLRLSTRIFLTLRMELFRGQTTLEIMLQGPLMCQRMFYLV